MRDDVVYLLSQYQLPVLLTLYTEGVLCYVLIPESSPGSTVASAALLEPSLVLPVLWGDCLSVLSASPIGHLIPTTRGEAETQRC